MRMPPRRLRSTRTQRRRRGAADAPLQRERGGCFRDGVWCGGSCRSCPETSWRGAAVVRSGGLPQGFLCGFFVQSPGRSRTAARRVRGAAEACVSSRRLRVGFSFSCSLALWPLAFWLTLPLDLDLTCLQRRRYHKEHLQLKRCRALSSAHDNISFATEQCTKNHAIPPPVRMQRCRAAAVAATTQAQCHAHGLGRPARM